MLDAQPMSERQEGPSSEAAISADRDQEGPIMHVSPQAAPETGSTQPHFDLEPLAQRSDS